MVKWTMHSNCSIKFLNQTVFQVPLWAGNSLKEGPALLIDILTVVNQRGYGTRKFSGGDADDVIVDIWIDPPSIVDVLVWHFPRNGKYLRQLKPSPKIDRFVWKACYDAIATNDKLLLLPSCLTTACNLWGSNSLPIGGWILRNLFSFSEIS
ncbi:hypothetical protein V6N11_009841 [Hibiscus sabdariffa]|uniref:Reverse transcriptase zinc-binding domain-containing protein n=1 Tax=Hibiscus sabdariffa TaxID=183260 RepID=A0ABR1ZKH1_9ROSI